MEGDQQGRKTGVGAIDQGQGGGVAPNSLLTWGRGVDAPSSWGKNPAGNGGKFSVGFKKR